MIANANSITIPLADKSVHCCVTSPPYWGLRDYGLPPTEWPTVTYTPMAGLAPVTVQGCEPGCAHEWVNASYQRRSNDGGKTDKQLSNAGSNNRDIPVQADFCAKCGGWRGSLGLEPTPEMFVGHIVAVFREVWRVLRDDGTCWVNFGDSYSGSGKAGYVGEWSKLGPRGMQGEKWVNPKLAANPVGRAPTPIGLKTKDLCGIPWRVAFALQADGWYLRNDIIWHKCLSGGTRVYARTQSGEGPDTIKDLARLDPSTVQLWNGEKWTQVKGFHETPRPDHPLEIVLRSGERVGCTPDHRWPTGRGLVEAQHLQVGDVIDYARLPEPDKPMDPYHLPEGIGWFVGMYLAEGSRGSADTIQISSHIDEESRYRRLCGLAESYGGTCHKYRTSDNGMTINVHSTVLNAILRTYINGHTAKDKHLAQACWKRGNGFLSSILTGYLEGDGHEDGNRYRIGFTRNYYLEQDLRTLCARLDYQIRLKPVTMTSQNGTHPGFRGEIRFKRSSHHNAKSDTEIVEIRRSRARKFWDIEVEDDPHVFALASGVLTHNSNPMPESVTDRCTKSHEYLFLLSKSQRYFYDNEAVKETSVYPGDTRHLRKDTRKQIDRMCIDGGSRARTGNPTRPTRNRRTVWTIPTRGYSGAHFATFPPALVAPCVLAGTSARGVCPVCGAPRERMVEKQPASHIGATGSAYPDGGNANRIALARQAARAAGGEYVNNVVTTGWRPTCEHDADPVPATVLDPFCGSGTVGEVCRTHSRKFVGFDLSSTYLRDLALPRAENKCTGGAIASLPLFGGA